MECTACQLFLLFAKVVGVLTALVVARGILWLVNLLLVAPRFDPLRNLPGPDASAFQSHFSEVNESVLHPTASISLSDTHPSPDITPAIYNDWTTNLFGKTFRYHGYGAHDYRLMSFDLRVLSHVLTSPVYEKPWQTRAYLGRLLGRGEIASVSPAAEIHDPFQESSTWKALSTGSLYVVQSRSYSFR
jgi:hypothetical protein